MALVVFNPSKKHHDAGIDLSLRINISTSITNAVKFKNNNKRKMWSREDDDVEDFISAKKLRRFSFYTPEEEAEEKLHGVCSKLKLYDDPWKIKKVLQESDVGTSCRLMISKRLVMQHIVEVWGRAGRDENVRGLNAEHGVSVKVWDCDRKKEYVLTMKTHPSTGCSVFLTNWSRQFVSERGLKKGDEIGLFWCNYSDRFFFSVLARAPAPAPAPAPDQPVYYLEGF
ncbi:B3 domain-containing protein [Heracleum sosnowskyi]|uniref:B3 domain-containing protein n=1 Tax=Heracleum sosnowskyi TaxID=360622 RepID=A0AAD8IIS4_9APIA|nr:B3 domain-containing protein [Heracleum sosnowskyi]